MARYTKICLAISLSLIGIFVIQSVARADTIGQQEVFSIDSQYDHKGRSQLSATMRSVSQRAYFYVANDYWDALDSVSRSRIDSLMLAMGTEFDTRIYPMETAFFGSDPQPGIDGDPRITMLLTTLKINVGGYFDSAHAYSRTQVPQSNQREMFYLNTGQFEDTARMYPFVAHEFQHLISFNQKELVRHVSDDVWLNELRSEYATTLLGYNQVYANSNFERRVSSFIQNPSDSLTEWPNSLADYSLIAVLGEYIAEHWSPRVIANTLATSSPGITSVNDALAQSGFQETFDTVFASWMIANAINDDSLDSHYAYTYPELRTMRVSATQTLQNIDDTTIMLINADVKDWEQRWYDIQGLAPGTKPVLRVNASSPQGLSDFRIPYLVFTEDGATLFQYATFASGTGDFFIQDIGTHITRILLMPYRRQKLSGFGSQETSVRLNLTLQRAEAQQVVAPTPESFGLREGDFIRAEGDNDIFIINNYGYKRLVLNPAICLQYGHLGARGCFSATRLVTPQVRDAFKTSPFYSNGETKDGKVYELVLIDDDTARLVITNKALNDSVFFINTREQRSYL